MWWVVESLFSSEEDEEFSSSAIGKKKGVNLLWYHWYHIREIIVYFLLIKRWMITWTYSWLHERIMIEYSPTAILGGPK